MNDRTYLKMMIAFEKEMKNVVSAKPYDPDAYTKIIGAMNRTTRLWHHSQRRRPWAALISVICLLIILLWIVFEVLTLLYMRGSQ